jgi:hypothetical protein|tara:strand:+ start:2205 stop:2681 length:477 start_codon:yes stop_codon:yes gene_type:complete
MATPTLPHEYQGKQVILNSDRVLFNSKTDSILGFAHEHISFSANGNIHFDTSDNTNSQIVFNSPNIHLGLEENEGFPSEHAVLGDQLERILGDMADAIDDLCTVIETQQIQINAAGPTAPGAPGACSLIRQELIDVKSNIPQIKSSRIKLPADNMFGK